MEKWAKYTGSKYTIRIDNNKLKFLLAGASKEDYLLNTSRQTIYHRILEKIAPDINDLTDYCSVDAGNIELQLVKQGDYIHVVGQTDPQAFEESITYDLGVIPTEKGFDKEVFAVWSALSEADKYRSLNVEGFKINAWSGLYTLLEISFNSKQVDEDVVKTTIKTPIKRAAVKTERSKSKVDPIDIQYLKAPVSIDFDTWKDARKYILSMCSAENLVRQLSTELGIKYGLPITPQAPPKRIKGTRGRPRKNSVR